jgi:hypothetical protein
MKIDNQTVYSTRHLRKIFIACEKNEGTNYKNRHVKVIYTKSGVATRGYAWYNSNRVVMKLPKPLKEHDYKNSACIHRVAKVYIHEVGHNLNLRHKEMMKWWDIPVDFLEEGDVEFKLEALLPKKEAVKISKKPKKTRAELNEEKARNKLAEWEKKLSRAKTFVKKYKTKVKYYDKKKESIAK